MITDLAERHNCACVLFDGTGDYAEVSGVSIVTDLSVNEFAITAKFDSLSGNDPMILNASGGNSAILLWQQTATTISLIVMDGTADYRSYTYTTTLTASHKYSVRIAGGNLEWLLDDIVVNLESSGSFGIITTTSMRLGHSFASSYFANVYVSNMSIGDKHYALTDAATGALSESGTDRSLDLTITSTSGTDAMQVRQDDMPALGTEYGGNLCAVLNADKHIVLPQIPNQGSATVNTIHEGVFDIPITGSDVRMFTIGNSRIGRIDAGGLFGVGGGGGYTYHTADYRGTGAHKWKVELQNSPDIRRIWIDDILVVNNTSTVWPINTDQAHTAFGNGASEQMRGCVGSYWRFWMNTAPTHDLKLDSLGKWLDLVDDTEYSMTGGDPVPALLSVLASNPAICVNGLPTENLAGMYINGSGETVVQQDATVFAAGISNHYSNASGTAIESRDIFQTNDYYSGTNGSGFAFLTRVDRWNFSSSRVYPPGSQFTEAEVLAEEAITGTSFADSGAMRDGNNDLMLDENNKVMFN